MHTVEQDVAAGRRRPFVLSVAAAAVGAAGHAAVAIGSEPGGVVLVRVLIVVILAVAFTATATRRVPVELGERIGWPAALAYAAVEVVPHVTRDVGDGLDGSMRVLLLHMTMVLLTYMVWPRGTARLLAAALTVAAYAGLAVTLAGSTGLATTPMLVVYPVVAVTMCEGYSVRARVLAGAAARAVAEADLGRVDQLTGLRNRRGLLPHLEELRVGDAILLVDVDHFKAVNDQHGHDVGDAVLRRVAATLAGAVREDDAIGRWGGEEFVVCAPRRADVQPRAATAGSALGERVRAAVRADGAPPRVTVSVGVAALQPDDTGWEDALRRADASLYAAKAEGRDRVVASPDEPTTTVSP